MHITSVRRITQSAFIIAIFLIPVLNIFRYDTATHELFFFGNVWTLGLKGTFYVDHSPSAALHIAFLFFLNAILPWIMLLSLFPLLGYLTGWFFCGWLCPEGTLFELADFLTLRLLGRRNLFSKKQDGPAVPARDKLFYGIITLFITVVIPPLGGVALTGYLVAPRTIWHQILSWDFAFGVKAGIIGVSIYMLVTSVLARHVICKFVCAAGLMQMLFGWVSPSSLRLTMDIARISACTDCRRCDKACFMNMVPRRHKRDISCVNCGACVEACNKELGKGYGLFHLSFGNGVSLHEKKEEKKRQNR